MPENTSHFASLDCQRLRCLRDLGVQTDCFFDVGASNGWWSRLVGGEFPEARFEMFEPLSDHVPAYAEPMKELLQQSPRFHLHKCALGTKSGKIQMDLLPDNPFGSTALQLKHRPKDSRSVQIEMRTIDDCVADMNLPVPNIIKMDTQGCELTILQGAQKTLPKVDALLCETWMVRTYGPDTPLLIELANWLRDAGFYLWDFGDVYREENGTLTSQDCIFLNARHKISRLSDELSNHSPTITDGSSHLASRKTWKDRLRKVFQ